MDLHSVVGSSLQDLVLNRYPTTFFSLAEFGLATLALGPLTSFIPLILLVSVLHIHGQRIAFRHTRGRELFWSWICITFGSFVAHYSAASTALSSTTQSAFAITTISFFTYFFAIAALYLDIALRGRLSTWPEITLFPFLWAAIWSFVSRVSPVGRLVNWSPTSTSHPYSWLIPFAGPTGIDWIVAAWAVLISELMALWFMGFEEYEGPTVAPKRSYVSQRRVGLFTLGTLLLGLTLPSFTNDNLPRRTDIYQQATDLKVGCVLPSLIDGRHPSLDDFIGETAKLTAAKFVLWPESAVTFNSHKDREAAFERVRKSSNGAYVGVAFEEYVDVGGAPSPSSRTKNGLAIVHKSQQPGEEVVQYYKRHLVPFTESFSKIPSVDPPRIHRVELKHPHGITAPEWAPAPNFTRSIPFSTSICLDFASPTAFTDLESRPSLILAPAKTWDTTVGLAMWEQAKTRAAELGSMVLWCDGGATGVSGIGGHGIQEIMQVGGGSWLRTIGVPWPFNEKRTVYATVGEFSVLAFLAAVMGSNYAARYLANNASRGALATLTRGQSLFYRIPFIRRMTPALSVDAERLAVEERGEQQHLLG